MEVTEAVRDRQGRVISEKVVLVATTVAACLRRSMSQNGIHQMADFVNGMMLAGILLEKSYRGCLDPKVGETFVDLFEACEGQMRTHFMSGAFTRDLEIIREHHIGITDQAPFDMLVTAAMSAKITIKEIALEQDLSPTEALQMVCIAIVAATVASGESTVVQA